MSSTAPPPGTTGLTYADLRKLPTPSEAGGDRYELLDGELLVSPSPATRHQLAVLAIAATLRSHTNRQGGTTLIAPTDVWFSDETVLEPDVLALTAARVDRVRWDRVVGAPDLVVEVSSPSTRRTDVVRKQRVYEREGVPEFWFVDLDADQIQVYRLGPDRTYGPPEVTLADGVVCSSSIEGMEIAAGEALALDAPGPH